MTAWDGRGLPPAAGDRVRRMAASGVRGSLLSAGELAGLESCGLEAAGEVMGCIVEHIGWQGFSGCGWSGYGVFGGPGTVVSGQSQRWAGYAPYVDALNRGWDVALSRMLEECSALGADGVVGVRLSQRGLGAGNTEFVALGSAVRARSRTRPRRPFSTNLAGQDVTKLLHAGWVPTSTVVGISVAVRHDDYATARQASRWRVNTEVAGYTELITHVRADSRHQFARRIARTGADSAIVSGIDLRVWEVEPSENHTDHVAESTVTGTGVARFSRSAARLTRSSSILPLRRL